jgi:hypothetical protein
MEKRKTCKSVLFYPTLKPKDLCKLPVAKSQSYLLFDPGTKTRFESSPKQKLQCAQCLLSNAFPHPHIAPPNPHIHTVLEGLQNWQ